MKCYFTIPHQMTHLKRPWTPFKKDFDPIDPTKNSWWRVALDFHQSKEMDHRWIRLSTPIHISFPWNAAIHQHTPMYRKGTISLLLTLLVNQRQWVHYGVKNLSYTLTSYGYLLLDYSERTIITWTTNSSEFFLLWLLVEWGLHGLLTCSGWDG